VSNYLLLTGATGLVGRFLTWDLLERGYRLALVIRGTKKESIHDRMESFLQIYERRTGHQLPRPVCLEGDVACEGLGLRPDDAKWVANNCSQVLHNAASLTFFGASRDEDPWRTNVGGTRNVLRACRQWEIGDLHYVSTAYVCGTRHGVILEEELDCGQRFRNDYEESKFLAEQLVREADFLDHLTVYRPAVIGGDSVTGYTNTYHGLYTYLKLMSVLVWNVEPDADGRRYTPVRLEMHGDERRNIVPADWVSAVICRLLETPEAHGGTYHLAPQRALTPREVIEAGYEYFNSYGVDFAGPNGQKVNFLGDMDRDAYDNTTIYQSYETTDPTFDTTNLLRFTADLPCPEIDREMLHRFWRYGEEDRWGKRRAPKPEVPFRVADQVMHRFGKSFSGNGSHGPGSNGSRLKGSSVRINLDVIGPGGSQWHFLLIGDRIGQPNRGLCEGATATLTISATDWERVQQEAWEVALHRLAAALRMHANERDPEALARSILVGLFARPRQTLLNTG